MAYVKKFNPGQLRIDLPCSNYFYELPLFSFGDTLGGLGVSLVYNYVAGTDGTDPFSVKNGYKLNLHKRIIFTGSDLSYYQNEIGKNIYLNKVCYADEVIVYTFSDESKRVIHPTSGGYRVENPDGSFEFFDTYGKIKYVKDKYSQEILTYTYSADNKLASVAYRTTRSVSLGYNSSGLLSTISYGGSVTNIAYTSSGVTLTLASGEIVALESSGRDFIAKAGEYPTAGATASFKNATRITYAIDNYNEIITATLSSLTYIEGEEEEIDTTTYVFRGDISATKLHNHVEITDHYGVTNRVQYVGEKAYCSYELTGGDVPFTDYGTMKRFAGTVSLLHTDSETGSVQATGGQAFRDGTSMMPPVSGSKVWTYSVDSSANAESGYYHLSGWARVTENFVDPESAVIYASNTPTSNGTEIVLDLTPHGQWKYFSCMVRLTGYYIRVYPDVSSDTIELKDLRLTFQEDVVEDDNGVFHLSIQEDGLLYHGEGSEVFIPLVRNTVSCNNDSALYDDYGTGVFFDDLLKNKINYKRGVNKTEFYYNHITECITKPENEDPLVSYNGSEYPLSGCYLAKRQYVKNNGYVMSVIVDDDPSGFLMYETRKPDGSFISRQILDSNLNIVSSTSEGVTTAYTRDNSGRVLTERATNTAGAVLYSHSTEYGNDTGTTFSIATTDENQNTTTQIYDSTWGALLSTTLPSGAIISNSYDDDKSVLTEMSFDSSASRKNTLGYLGGNISSMSTGSLTYGFGYTGADLTSVSRGTSKIEEYEYTDTSVAEYYPSKDIKSFEYVTNFDKYGRITSVNNTLTNEYDVLALFDSSGARTPFLNNKDAHLVTSTDEVVGEIARYEYDTKERLTKKSVTSKTDFNTKISNDEFTYDDKNRLYTHKHTYDVSGNKYVKSTVIYKKNTSDVTADGTVLQYLYNVRGTTRSTVTNTFDTFNRVSKKTYTIGGATFYKELEFSGARLTAIHDKYTNSYSRGDWTYTYDSEGRIASQKLTLSGTEKNVSFVYDSYGQLIRENNQLYGYTLAYGYDTVGNITHVKKYAYTTDETLPTSATSTRSFTYSTANKDRLTSYNGASISYDNYGYVSSYDGFDYGWTRGRLSSVKKGNPRMTTGDYEATLLTYNGHGQRKSKMYIFNSKAPTIGDALPTYNTSYKYDASGRLVYEYCTEAYKSTGATHTHELVYLYDESSVVGVMYSYDGGTSKAYYYQKNLFGDVVAIMDISGNKVAEYTYDAWGNCNMVGYANPHLASYNPIRYRSYYYDRETRLYYLNSRYYSPEWHRFISHDDSAYLDPESANGLNLYAYCNNDPVNYADPSGNNVVETIIDAVSVVWSAYEFYKEPTFINFCWLLLDVGFLVVPFITGSKLIEAASKLDEVAYLKNGVNSLDNMYDTIVLGNDMNRVMDRAFNIGATFYGGYGPLNALNAIHDFENATDAMKYAGKLDNVRFIIDKVNDGYKIVHIGSDGRSFLKMMKSAYGMELKILYRLKIGNKLHKAWWIFSLARRIF